MLLARQWVQVFGVPSSGQCKTILILPTLETKSLPSLSEQPLGTCEKVIEGERFLPLKRG